MSQHSDFFVYIGEAENKLLCVWQYADADIFFLVFKTFENCKLWAEEVKQACPNAQIVLVGISQPPSGMEIAKKIGKMIIYKCILY